MEQLEIKWQTPVSSINTAAQTHRAGSVEVTPQWLMGLFSAKFVSAEDQNAVLGKLTSVSVTVEGSLFISLKGHHIVTSVIVAMGSRLPQVVKCSCSQSETSPRGTGTFRRSAF